MFFGALRPRQQSAPSGLHASSYDEYIRQQDNRFPVFGRDGYEMLKPETEANRRKLAYPTFTNACAGILQRMGDRKLDVCVNTVEDSSTSDKNLVNFGRATRCPLPRI